MAKKSKRKKQDYAKGWETRRRNAALKAAAAGSGPEQAHPIFRVRRIENNPSGVRTTVLGAIQQGNGRPLTGAEISIAQGSAGALETFAPARPFAVKARQVLVEARRKGDVLEKIEDILAEVARHADYEAAQRVSDTHYENIKAIHEANAIQVVAAFMAEMEGIGALNRGPLPATVMVSGFTLARVTDALAKAGYSKEGFKVSKSEIMGRSHI